jgi:hypothetical protein
MTKLCFAGSVSSWPMMDMTCNIHEDVQVAEHQPSEPLRFSKPCLVRHLPILVALEWDHLFAAVVGFIEKEEQLLQLHLQLGSLV